MDKASYFSKSVINFYANNHHICIQIAPFSGREVVTLDGAVVSRSRSWVKSTCHKFIYDGFAYELRMKMTSILQGPFDCILYCDGHKVSHKRLHVIVPDKPDETHRSVSDFFSKNVLYPLWISVSIALMVLVFKEFSVWLLVTGVIFIELALRKKKAPSKQIKLPYIELVLPKE